MKYIDAEKLIAEIERRIREYDDIHEKRDLDDLTSICAVELSRELENILSFIASLQQEQTEVDFEGAYKSYMQSRKDDLSGNAVTVNMKDLARHFFGLGKLNARKEK